MLGLKSEMNTKFFIPYLYSFWKIPLKLLPKYVNVYWAWVPILSEPYKNIVAMKTVWSWDIAFHCMLPQKGIVYCRLEFAILDLGS